MKVKLFFKLMNAIEAADWIGLQCDIITSMHPAARPPYHEWRAELVKVNGYLGASSVNSIVDDYLRRFPDKFYAMETYTT